VNGFVHEGALIFTINIDLIDTVEVLRAGVTPFREHLAKEHCRGILTR